MATIGSTNLNDTPTDTRQLTDEELDRCRRLPRGCDQQGRHPESAEACTEVGATEESSQLTICIGGLAWLVGTVGFWVVVASLVWSVFST